ncbi:DUF1015 domain-containing protein [Inmirania thermothiophila]|uniref:Uncharacterized protein (DUF1015 family) n=1 Tax=Inmirania thermothiophila TaxID=1750597 RepID=A0A3N1XSV6_9GAMM|nr:DUF1015 family protein [Inmirania thermothiophila]ROR29734.1 uncharacterized protein (DUF1015 family) [Inmirania thermothiophila]
MRLARAFAGLRPAPGRAAEVIAPPYDVVSTEEARALAAGRPWSFLHISRPEIDLPPGTDPHDDAVYRRGAENLARMMREGVLVRDPAPRLYVYRMAAEGHEQTGVVAAVSVAAYEAGRVRRHEHTRPDKEADRARQIDVLDAQTGPVLLAHRGSGALQALVAEVAAAPPEVDVVAPHDGVRHQIWPVADPARVAALEAALDALDALYIADGHHRSAAAARVAAERRRRHGDDPEAPWARFLGVIFPAAQMRILDYNRVVRDLAGHTPEGFLEALRRRMRVEPAERPVAPERPATFGMYLDGRWYRLALDPSRLPEDPVRRLDVSLLSEHVLEPLLGIRDPRRDARIDFVGGVRGLAELERRVDAGEMAVAFSMHPTPMEALMAVADRGEVMPPKSTWFEPKLADGLVSHLLGPAP